MPPIAPSEIKEYRRSYYAKNRDKINLRRKKWRSLPVNRQKELAYKRKRYAQQLPVDLEYRKSYRKRSSALAKIRYHANREETLSKCREYYHRDKERIRERILLRKYGVSRERFEQQLKKQNGKCPICKCKLKKGQMHIDHCHKAGHVRGILCFLCNTGLGSFRHSLDVLQGAIEYLSGEVLFNGH